MPKKLSTRQAGVLLHISSLPDGELGEDAFKFIDFLADCGARVWQTLPINMPHADNSPYQCLSAHAGNTAFISLSQLVKDGLLETSELALGREEALKCALARLEKQGSHEEFNAFCETHQSWLDDFSLYLILRRKNGLAGWSAWPEPLKNRLPQALNTFGLENTQAIKQIKFEQFLFFKQWQQLKNYAHHKKIELFGDIPIFVAYDSADVWAHPDLFKLDKDKQMTVVAGVPPDYFSATGQRWGNPHYNWDKMVKDGFAWWIARLHTQSELFDLVRIDHFRGLQAAWEIPAEEQTAMNGEWVDAPGDALLAAIRKALPQVKLIAEDLGIITPEVDALRLKYQLPGMKILQFAFGGDDTNPYLPEHIDEASVAYTGTHDNDTTLGWYTQAEPHVKAHLHRYLAQEAPKMPAALVELTFNSNAYLAIIPMQDVLCLNSDCRMNTPGTIVGNWAWRFSWQQLTADKQALFKQQIQSSRRANG